jgi:hypothetical protein
MVARPESAAGVAFDDMARAVAGALGWRHVSPDAAAQSLAARSA